MIEFSLIIPFLVLLQLKFINLMPPVKLLLPLQSKVLFLITKLTEPLRISSQSIKPTPLILQILPLTPHSH